MNGNNEDEILSGFELLNSLSDCHFQNQDDLRELCEKLLDHPCSAVSIEAGNSLARIGSSKSIAALTRHVEKLNNLPDVIASRRSDSENGN
ncbi:HEAT repeat domain-containing protein [Candidatus Riflebacteria bacterium]